MVRFVSGTQHHTPKIVSNLFRVASFKGVEVATQPWCDRNHFIIRPLGANGIAFFSVDTLIFL